jgi:hypothetical protein
MMSSRIWDNGRFACHPVSDSSLLTSGTLRTHVLEAHFVGNVVRHVED